MRKIFEDGGGPPDKHLVPSHVRDLEPGNIRKAYDFSGKQIETGVFAVLIAPGEEQLQTKTDSQEWLAFSNMLDQGRHHPRFMQPGNCILKCADTGQHYLVGLGYLIGIATDKGRMPDFLESLLHTSEVAHPVINDDNRLHDSSFLPVPSSPASPSRV